MQKGLLKSNAAKRSSARADKTSERLETISTHYGSCAWTPRKGFSAWTKQGEVEMFDNGGQRAVELMLLSMSSCLTFFLAELKRRKVYRVATVYVVVGAGIIGLGEAAIPSNIWEGIQIPVGLIILIGLPIALILAWAYEVRPEEPGEGR